MFEHLDDPSPLAPTARTFRAVLSRAARLRRQRIVSGVAVVGVGTLAHLASTGLSDDTLVRLREPATMDDLMPHCDTLRTGTITLLGSRGERDIEYPDLASCSSDHQALAFVPLSAAKKPVARCV